MNSAISRTVPESTCWVERLVYERQVGCLLDLGDGRVELRRCTAGDRKVRGQGSVTASTGWATGTEASTRHHPSGCRVQPQAWPCARQAARPSPRKVAARLRDLRTRRSPTLRWGRPRLPLRALRTYARRRDWQTGAAQASEFRWSTIRRDAPRDSCTPRVTTAQSVTTPRSRGWCLPYLSAAYPRALSRRVAGSFVSRWGERGRGEALRDERALQPPASGVRDPAAGGQGLGGGSGAGAVLSRPRVGWAGARLHQPEHHVHDVEPAAPGSDAEGLRRHPCDEIRRVKTTTVTRGLGFPHAIAAVQIVRRRRNAATWSAI